MIEIKLFRSTDIDKDEWRQLQGIEREAFSHSLNRTQNEVDELISWNDPLRFLASHQDPNLEVGKRYNPNQSFTRPCVAVATESGEPIGFAYSAHNVSGSSERDRLIKRISVIKNYLWVREIVVKPEHQNQGVAKYLGRTLLNNAIKMQPVSAYVWPDEDAGFMQDKLQSIGFSATGEQLENIYGEQSEPIRQVRMQAPTVGTVLRHIS